MKKAFIFYIALFLFILIFSINSTNYDFDLWARLIAGMGVVDGGHVLTQDFLSYTPVHTWWDHEWGSGVIFYFFLKHFGPYSLIILQSLLIFGIFFTASRIIKIRTDESPYNILFYFFAISSIIINLNQPIRCHLFSFLFFTIFIYILEKVRLGNNKLLFIIPPIIIFWNNVHGGVIAGLGLIFMYLIGEILNKKPYKKYIITLLISCMVLLINPWGFDYIKFLIMANTMPRPYIVEWWSIFHPSHIFDYLDFKLFGFIMLAAEVIYINKQIQTEKFKNWLCNTDKVKYIVILATTYLSIIHIKLMPFFIIAALCFIYEDFYKLIKNINFPKWKDTIIYGIIFFITIFTLITKDFSVPLNFEKYPIKHVEFIKQNNIKGKILTNFGIGSYVAYKLYPNNTVFMDGRYEEVYPDYLILMLKQFHLVTQNWDEILKYFTPDVMILEKKYPIYIVMEKQKNWQLVYEDNNFGVFVPKSEKKFVKPTDDIKYYKENMFTTDIKF